EPMHTLQSYRSFESGVLFGVNAVIAGTQADSVLSVGDQLVPELDICARFRKRGPAAGLRRSCLPHPARPAAPALRLSHQADEGGAAWECGPAHGPPPAGWPPHPPPARAA